MVVWTGGAARGSRLKIAGSSSPLLWPTSERLVDYEKVLLACVLVITKLDYDIAGIIEGVREDSSVNPGQLLKCANGQALGAPS
jgi:hypothetical protein